MPSVATTPRRMEIFARALDRAAASAIVPKPQVDQLRSALMAADAQGRSWTIDPEFQRWGRLDGELWMVDDPPAQLFMDADLRASLESIEALTARAIVKGADAHAPRTPYFRTPNAPPESHGVLPPAPPREPDVAPPARIDRSPAPPREPDVAPPARSDRNPPPREPDVAPPARIDRSPAPLAQPEVLSVSASTQVNAPIAAAPIQPPAPDANGEPAPPAIVTAPLAPEPVLPVAATAPPAPEAVPIFSVVRTVISQTVDESDVPVAAAVVLTPAATPAPTRSAIPEAHRRFMGPGVAPGPNTAATPAPVTPVVTPARERVRAPIELRAAVRSRDTSRERDPWVPTSIAPRLTAEHHEAHDDRSHVVVCGVLATLFLALAVWKGDGLGYAAASLFALLAISLLALNLAQSRHD